MKILNVMNFVRQCEPRDAETEKKLFSTTASQLAMVKEQDIDNTFLLQYDALCDPRYVELFRNEINEKTELGLWYEIVQELTDAVGIPYESELGWKWDWHIKPGFSMAYSLSDREKLIDEAMRKFKEVFGYYPKTVGSWIMDTHTINYLTDNYDISMMCNCRDQVNTDAYTLIGGYFNQAYFPSRKNMHTPAQSAELTVKTPMFRLLGPDPIHNYDWYKYLSKNCEKKTPCFTMEAVWSGKYPEVNDWYYKTFYENENMGFSYAQIGQENSFAMYDLVNPIKMQIEKAKALKDVRIMKMRDTGEAFKKKYGAETPVTSVCAMDNWDSEDVQSIYYDCKNYTANLFRHNKKVFIRALYLFDENAEDYYNGKCCTTFDAVYENQPVVDTVIWDDGESECGMYLDLDGAQLKTERLSEKALKVSWGDKYVIFYENKTEIKNCDVAFYKGNAKADITPSADRIGYCYRGRKYEVFASVGEIVQENDCIKILSENGNICLEYSVQK